MMPGVSRQFTFLTGICNAFCPVGMISTLLCLRHNQRNAVSFFIPSLGCQNQVTVCSASKRAHRLVVRLFIQIDPDRQSENLSHVPGLRPVARSCPLLLSLAAPCCRPGPHSTVPPLIRQFTFLSLLFHCYGLSLLPVHRS